MFGTGKQDTSFIVIQDKHTGKFFVNRVIDTIVRDTWTENEYIATRYYTDVDAMSIIHDLGGLRSMTIRTV